MKYSFTPVQPQEKAASAARRTSSSVTSLLMTRRRRWLPASGAKVMACRPGPATALATSTEKLSTRRLGRESSGVLAQLALEGPHHGHDLGVVGGAEGHERELAIAGVGQQLAGRVHHLLGARSRRGR